MLTRAEYESKIADMKHTLEAFENAPACDLHGKDHLVICEHCGAIDCCGETQQTEQHYGHRVRGCQCRNDE
jgi:hypothetical protein